MAQVAQVALVAAACGCGKTAGEPPRPSPTAPTALAAPSASAAPVSPLPAKAEHVVGGRKVVASLVIDKARFMSSEPVFAGVAFSAPDGPAELEISWMGRNPLRQDTSYEVALTDAAGVAVPGRKVKESFGGQTWTQKLTEARDFRSHLLLPYWIEAPRPGRYTLRVQTNVRARVDAKAEWQPLAVRLELPVEVIADDAAALGVVIDALGARALAKGDDASRAAEQLQAIRDPRVVPHWVRHAEEPSYDRKLEAVRALASWNDDRALSAIVRVSKTRGKDLPAEGYANDELRESSAALLRVAAAQALDTSAHPGALDALLALESDPSASVRLVVAQHLEKVKDDRAVPLLQAFTKDPDALVRSESARILDARRR